MYVIVSTHTLLYYSGYVWGRKAEHGIENMGGLRWQLVLVLMLAWVIVTLCVIKGIKSSGRVRKPTKLINTNNCSWYYGTHTYVYNTNVLA